MIDIKDISGNIRFSTPVNTGSKRKFLLMKEDYITLKFSLKEPVYFKLGDYVDDPQLGRFELCDLYKPTYNESDKGYDYELRLDAYYWKWKNKMFKYTPETGGKEASWNLTATLDVHLGIFLRNLKALGYTYRGKDFDISEELEVGSTAKLISYDKTNLLDALTKMAEAWECEWWVKDHTICFGRCEENEPVDFKLGENVSSMQRSDSRTDYATRIYAFGSTRNIPATYRKKLIFTNSTAGNELSDSFRKLISGYFKENSLIKNELAINLPNGMYTYDKGVTVNAYIYTPLKNGLKKGNYELAINHINYAARITSGLNLTGSFTLRVLLEYKQSGVTKSIELVNVQAPTNNAPKAEFAFVEVKDKKVVFTLDSDVTGCVIKSFTSVGFETHYNSAIIQFYPFALDVNYGSFSNLATVTFLSGINQGQTFDGVFNPTFLSEDKGNILRLPQGITASVGDKYTIDNIIKSKVPVSYFTQDRESQAVEGIVTKHLMMPESVPYIDAYPDMKEEEAVEQVVVFDDIYPKRTGTVGGVFTHTYKEPVENPDGTKTENLRTAWRFKDADPAFRFSEKYMLERGELRVVFQTGTLAGMDFAVKFNPYDKKGSDQYQPEQLPDGTWNANAQVFEIIENDDYGRTLPDDILHPDDNKGNTYILYGYDPQFVSDALIPNAEADLEKAARDYILKLKEDPSTYDATMMSAYIYGVHPETGEADPVFTRQFGVGQKVNLINQAYFEEGRASRIIGFEFKLDLPYDSPVYTIGETASYSRLGELESKIESLTYKTGKSKPQVIVSNGSVSSAGDSENGVSKLQSTLSVTASAVGYIKSGDVLTAGTTLEDVFRKMLVDARIEKASLTGKISTSNDVEYGTQKGVLTYTAIRGGQGPMKYAYYDGNPDAALSFSEDVGGVQTATRQLTGIYSERETYEAAAVYAASEDGKLPETTVSNTLSVNVYRKWFAGVCDEIPTTSAQVRALSTSGLYAGGGSYKFNVSEWTTIAICIPSGAISEVSRTKTPGNYLESPGVYQGTKKISVEGINGSQAIPYTMYIFQVDTKSDPDTFTFKIN